ncbi:MAG: IS630 family transposase, partial [Promethearchaeota archaeon]
MSISSAEIRIYSKMSNLKSAKQKIRLLAIIWGYQSNFYPKVQDTANRLGVTRSTVYHWIRKWNKYGLKGILIKKPSGAPRKLTDQECAELIQDILENPRNSGYDFSTWTLKAIVAHISTKFNKVMTISGVHAMLKRNNITLVMPRPLPTKGDPHKKEAFKQHLEVIVKDLDDDEEIFFQDESTFCQLGIPRRVWAVKGAKPTLPIYGTYSKLNVFGMINPISGKSHFSFIKRLNGDCFIQFLKLILKEDPNSKKIYIVVDNAPGHR